MGAIFNNRYIVATWDKQFLINERPSIEFLELFALFVALETLGSSSKTVQH